VALGNITEQDASSLLDDLRLGLNADGYDLLVSGIDEKLRLDIVARDDSCEDCLVPKETMTQYAVAALQERYSTITPDDIVMAYPAQQH
jgi:hypothetical protein